MPEAIGLSQESRDENWKNIEGVVNDARSDLDEEANSERIKTEQQRQQVVDFLNSRLHGGEIGGGSLDYRDIADVLFPELAEELVEAEKKVEEIKERRGKKIDEVVIPLVKSVIDASDAVERVNAVTGGYRFIDEEGKPDELATFK
jgi:hypothetical protein